MDNKTYGVKIVAITDGFKNKMTNLQNMAEKSCQKIKNSFNRVKTEFNYGISGKASQDLEQLKGKAEKLKQSLKEASDMGFDIKGLSSYDNLAKTENQIKSLNSKAIRLGMVLRQAFDKAKTSAKGLADEIRRAWTETDKTEKKSENLGKTVGRNFERGTKKIMRYALSLFGIRSIFALISRASSAYLAQDTELANKLQSVWAGLGAFLVPVIEKIANMLMKLVAYLNVFIKAVTGQDLLAKASEKATNKIKAQTKATKGLNKALSGLDEITNVQDDSASGGGAEITNPFEGFGDIKLNDKLVKKLEKLGAGIRKFYEDHLKPFINYIKENWKWLLPLIAGLGIVVLLVVSRLKKGGTGLKDVATNFTGFFDALGNAVQIIALLGGIALVVKSVGDLFEQFGKSGLSVKDGLILLGGALAEIAGGFALIAVASKMLDLKQSVGAFVILAGLAVVLKTISDLFVTFQKNGIKVGQALGTLGGILAIVVVTMGIFVALATVLGSDPKVMIALVLLVASLSATLLIIKATLPTILNAVSKFITAVMPSLIALLTTIGNIIVNIIYSLGTVLPPIVKEIGNLFSKIFGGVSLVIDTVGKNIVNIMNTAKWLVIDVLNAILNFINRLGPAINNFVDNVIKAVTKLVNFVVSGIEYLINTVIVRPLNTLIKAVKGSAIAEAVGLDKKLTTLNSVKIARFAPQLNVGTNYVPEDQLAYIHKGEAVIPKKFNSAEYFNQGTNNDDVKALLAETNRLLVKIEEKDNNTYLDGREIGKSTVDYIKKQNRILGRSII